MIAFIRKNHDRSISVNQIATSLNTTRRTLERHVETVLKSSVNNEIAKIRVEQAKRLLVDTDLLVKQIATKTGFGETRRLNDNFRRIEGCLPTAYRSQWKKLTGN